MQLQCEELSMNIVNPLSALSNNLGFSLLGLLGLGFLIGFHELGHFLFCKLFSVSTPSFSIGFGPQLFKKKIGDTEFSISAIPIGGYVEIAGSAEIGQGKQHEATRRDQYSFATKPFYQKILIMSGGILFNMLFAYFALTTLFALGLPKTEMLYPINTVPIINSIEKGSSAEQYGLHEGDRIIAFNGQNMNDDTKLLIEKLQSHAHQPVTLLIERNHEMHEINVTIGSRQFFGETVGSLGITFTMTELPGYSLFESLKWGIYLTNRYIYNIFYAFKSIFIQRNFSSMGGPLMVISETIKGARKGIKIFLLYLAILSINLAILNLLPLPILDGGQIMFYTIEAIIRRPIPNRIREYIHIASWIAFLLLLIYLSMKDIARLGGSYFKTLIQTLRGK